MPIFMTGLATASYTAILLFVPESPEWLLQQGKQEEALKAFEIIANGNGVAGLSPESRLTEV